MNVFQNYKHTDTVFLILVKTTYHKKKHMTLP